MIVLGDIFSYFEDLISGMLPFALIVFGGVFITVKGNFFQFSGLLRSFGLIKKAFAQKKNSNGEMSSFSAACTALSATVGTGNIAGVAGAISIGGAGAVFWMWISALAGMAIKYGEVALAIIYREKKGCSFCGGPMYYIKNGMSAAFKPLAYIFVIAAMPAVICSGNITQTNAAVLSLGEGIGIRFTAGIIFTVLTAAVATGGISRIGAVTEKVVPIMAVVYIIMSLGVIIINIDLLPKAFFMITEGAFSPKAVTGGAVGSVMTAMITGASRGVFSNEAGLGTSAMAHSAAADAQSETQGLFGVFEVFVDTILLCTLTALTILCSRVNISYGSIASSELVGEALSLCYGKLSTVLLAGMMCIFAFSSVIGWAVYGNICFEFLFGSFGVKLFNIIYPFGCLVGALCNAELAWRLSAFFNGVMLCVNLPAIILMSDKFLKCKRGIVSDRKIKKNKGNFNALSGGADIRR